MPGKKQFSPEEKAFVLANYEKMGNMEMAKILGWKVATFRQLVYEMGLYRMRLEYWTEEQVQYLRANYREMGDSELASNMQLLWPKNKGWHKKHIEKKRKYLKIKRTKEELKAIFERNLDTGKWANTARKRWDKTGSAPEGEIRFWTNKLGRISARIKINNRWIYYTRYRWEQLHGPLPPGMNVMHKDGNPSNIEDDNLTVLSNAEVVRKNCVESIRKLSDNYIAGMMTFNNIELREELKKHPQLLDLKRQQLILNRKINEYEQSKSTGKN
jgi:hypothetical protein